MVLVDLSLALLCIYGVPGVANSCYPALVGKDTPTGEFQMVQLITAQAGYGGDVLKFKETRDSWYAIHRVWTLNPKEHRKERLSSSDVKQRQTITHGCINVEPEVYEKLRDCCSQEQLLIK